MLLGIYICKDSDKNLGGSVSVIFKGNSSDVGCSLIKLSAAILSCHATHKMDMQFVQLNYMKMWLFEFKIFHNLLYDLLKISI